MSRENVELVRGFMPEDGTDLTAVFAEPGAASAGGLLNDDAPVRFVAASGEMGGKGPEGFYETWRDWLAPWESYRIYTEEIVDRGDRVVALVRLAGVTQRDGVEMGHDAATVFRFEDGRIAEIVFTLDRGEVLGA